MNKDITVEKLRKALMKDFESLYVKEFTTDWKVQRLIRQVEIGLMPLTNTMELLKNNGIVRFWLVGKK